MLPVLFPTGINNWHSGHDWLLVEDALKLNWVQNFSQSVRSGKHRPVLFQNIFAYSKVAGSVCPWGKYETLTSASPAPQQQIRSSDKLKSYDHVINFGKQLLFLILHAWLFKNAEISLTTTEFHVNQSWHAAFRDRLCSMSSIKVPLNPVGAINVGTVNCVYVWTVSFYVRTALGLGCG